MISEGSKRVTLELIQAGKGIAAMAVVLLYVLGTLQSGEFIGLSSGIDFFFVLSGFIICFAYGKGLGKLSTVPVFLKNRFIRIYPLYFLVILSYFLANIAAHGGGSTWKWKIIVKSFLLIPQPHSGIFPVEMTGGTLGHLALLYLLFALVIPLSAGPRFGLIVAWIALNVAFMSGYIPRRLDFLFSFHHFEFLLGCLCAFIAERNYRLFPGMMALFLGASFLVLQMVNEFFGLFDVHHFIAYGIPFSLIVFGLASYDLFRRVKLNPLFGKLGDASYSLYLTHFGVAKFSLTILGSLVPAGKVGVAVSGLITLGVCIVVGLAVHEIVEKPLLRKIRAWSAPTVAERPQSGVKIPTDGTSLTLETRVGQAEDTAMRNQPVTTKQLERISVELSRVGLDDQAGRIFMEESVGKRSRHELTVAEATAFIDTLVTLDTGRWILETSN